MAYSDELRRKSLEEIAADVGGWKPGSEQHWLCLFEIERRRNREPTIRSWIAIGVSLLALGVALARI